MPRKRTDPLTPEHRAKIGAALKGRPKTKAHRKAIGRGLRGNPRHRAGIVAGWERKSPEERRAVALRGHETRRRKAQT